MAKGCLTVEKGRVLIRNSTDAREGMHSALLNYLGVSCPVVAFTSLFSKMQKGGRKSVSGDEFLVLGLHYFVLQ